MSEVPNQMARYRGTEGDKRSRKRKPKLRLLRMNSEHRQAGENKNEIRRTRLGK